MGFGLVYRFKVVFLFLLLAGVTVKVCSAPQPPREPAPIERGVLAEKFVREKLPFWQNRLQLQDWKISVLAVHPSDMRPHTLGNIHWDTDNKTAVIRVLNASDYQTPFRATLDDLEFTLVHELIHLELVPLPRSEASRSDEEYAINHLAAALIQSEHQDHRTK